MVINNKIIDSINLDICVIRFSIVCSSFVLCLSSMIPSLRMYHFIYHKLPRLELKQAFCTINMLTATGVFKEISVRPRVQQLSHRYFSNASRTSGGLKNDLSFRLFATLKPLAVV